MSVLIKGMEMPKCCIDCTLLYDSFACMPLGKGIDWGTSGKERLPDCPLVEVKEPTVIEAEGDRNATCGCEPEDYTKLPKYANDTPSDACFHYARDLFREFCPNYGTLFSPCAGCEFPERMGDPRSKCCGWTIGMAPDRAIKVLRELLKEQMKKEDDDDV